MSFSAADIGEIKWSLLTCLLSFAAALGMINYSASLQEDALKSLKQAQHQLSDARNKLATAQSDQENMASYQMEYEALVAQKVIGNEPRLDWIEGLDRIGKQKLTSGFQYAIAPQETYAPNPPLEVGNFALSVSHMSIQADLLHEAQLIQLLDAISSRMPGWFLIDKCSISRNSTNSSTVILRSDCSGGWFTMKNRSAP